MKISRATERIQAATQHLQEAAGRHADEIRTQAQSGKHYLEEQAQQAREKARELSGEAETLVKARPWLAMGAAALIGLALARLLR